MRTVRGHGRGVRPVAVEHAGRRRNLGGVDDEAIATRLKGVVATGDAARNLIDETVRLRGIGAQKGQRNGGAKRTRRGNGQQRSAALGRHLATHDTGLERDQREVTGDRVELIATVGHRIPGDCGGRLSEQHRVDHRSDRRPYLEVVARRRAAAHERSVIKVGLDVSADRGIEDRNPILHREKVVE